MWCSIRSVVSWVARAAGAVARLGRFALIGYASGSWATLDPLAMVLGGEGLMPRHWRVGTGALNG